MKFPLFNIKFSRVHRRSKALGNIHMVLIVERQRMQKMESIKCSVKISWEMLACIKGKKQHRLAKIIGNLLKIEKLSSNNGLQVKFDQDSCNAVILVLFSFVYLLLPQVAFFMIVKQQQQFQLLYLYITYFQETEIISIPEFSA